MEALADLVAKSRCQSIVEHRQSSTLCTLVPIGIRVLLCMSMCIRYTCAAVHEHVRWYTVCMCIYGIRVLLCMSMCICVRVHTHTHAARAVQHLQKQVILSHRLSLSWCLHSQRFSPLRLGCFSLALRWASNIACRSRLLQCA